MPFIRITCTTLLVIMELICLLSLKWRKLTDWIMYTMILYHVTVSLVPTDKYDRQSPVWIFFMGFSGFIVYYTDSGIQIIYNLVMTVAMLILPHTLTYGESNSLSRVIEIVLCTIAMLLLTSCIGIVIRYISSMHLRMKTQNE